MVVDKGEKTRKKEIKSVNNSLLKTHKKRNMKSYDKSMDLSMSEKYIQIANKINFEKAKVIVDFGTGTGYLAFTIAKNYPNIKVIGSDISPNYVKKAKDKFNLPNLDFIVISSNKNTYTFTFKGTKVNPDYIIFSSVIHEVFSYEPVNENDNPLEQDIKRLNAVKNCLRKAKDALNTNGKIIIRDFCGPEQNRYCALKILEKIPKKYSIIEFCKNKKFKVNPLLFTKCDETTYITNEKTLYEYIYHKDWRECWNQEFEERYGFWNRALALSIIESLGYSNVTYDILSGEWIKNNRFFNKIRVSRELHNDILSCQSDKCEKPLWDDTIFPQYQILLVASK